MDPKRDFSQNFSDFLHRFTVVYTLKIDLNDLIEKILVLRLLGQRGPEMGPK